MNIFSIIFSFCCIILFIIFAACCGEYKIIYIYIYIYIYIEYAVVTASEYAKIISHPLRPSWCGTTSMLPFVVDPHHSNPTNLINSSHQN